MKTKIVRHINAQPRLITAILLGVVLWFVVPGRVATRLLVSWDCATGLYLIMAMAMMGRSNIERIRVRATLQDEGQAVILGLVTITALISLAGVVAELSFAKSYPGHDGWRHVLLAALTVLLSWTFLHTMFAVHYAHEYYAESREGLDFPGDEPPDYWDFVYYSFIIGTACATADVDITNKRMRNLTTLHCIIAFFFNTTILALMVNIGADFF